MLRRYAIKNHKIDRTSAFGVLVNESAKGNCRGMQLSSMTISLLLIPFFARPFRFRVRNNRKLSSSMLNSFWLWVRVDHSTEINILYFDSVSVCLFCAPSERKGVVISVGQAKINRKVMQLSVNQIDRFAVMNSKSISDINWSTSTKFLQFMWW